MALGIVLFLLIGILAGWIAGKLIQGGGFGLIGNMVVGVVGAVLGGYVLGAAGIDLGGFFGQLVTAVLGALILLFGVSLIKRS
ncbi:MAG: GlsB/YeaQ/YmgE family stress response membrane protein [Geminicoccaceae bacterium]